VTGLVNGDTSSVLSGLVLSTSATSSSGAGAYRITASGASDSDYAISYTPGTLTIVPMPATPTVLVVGSSSGTYGATTTLTATLTAAGQPLGGQAVDFELGSVDLGSVPTNASGVATLTGVSLVGLGAGTYGSEVTARYVGSAATEGSLGIGALTVSPAVLTVTASDGTKVYGSPLPALEYTLSGFVNGDTSSVVSGSPTLTTTASASSHVSGGPYTIVPGVGTLSAANYTFASFVNGTLTVTPAPLTVTATDATKVYGSSLPSLSYALSGFVNGDTSRVVSGTPTLTTSATPSSHVSGGPYAIVAGLGTLSASDYTFTNFGSGIMTVTPAVLTVTATDASKAYGAAVPSLSYRLSGFVNGDTSAVVGGVPALATTATTSSHVTAGPYAITPGAGTLSASDYTFQYVSGALTVTPVPLAVKADDVSTVYGTAPALSCTLSGFVNGNTASVVTGAPALATTATATSHVAGGPYLVSISAGTLSASDYTFDDFVDGSVSITPAPLTATADDASKLYGAGIPPLSYTLSGFVNGDAPSVITGAPVLSTTATAASHVAGGPYRITITAGTLSAADYTIANLVGGVLTVTPAALTVSAANASKVYGAPVPALSYTLSGFVNGDTPSVVNGAPALSTTASAASHVLASPYPIIASAGMLSASDYTFSRFLDGDLTITPAALTVTANNVSKVYGDPVPALTYALSGLVNGDASAVVHGTPLLSTTATAASHVVGSPYRITVTPGSLSASDYTIANLVGGALTVTPAPLTVTANDATKVYGDPIPALGYTIDGLVNGDTPAAIAGAPTIKTAASAGSPVGEYPIQVAVGTLSTADYAVTRLVSGTLSVTPALLTITANDASKVVGQAIPAFTAQYQGLVNGDPSARLNVTLTTTATPASSPGEYAIVPAAASDPNYTIRFVAGTLTVSQTALQSDPAHPGKSILFVGAPSPTAPITIVRKGGRAGVIEAISRHHLLGAFEAAAVSQVVTFGGAGVHRLSIAPVTTRPSVGATPKSGSHAANKPGRPSGEPISSPAAIDLNSMMQDVIIAGASSPRSDQILIFGQAETEPGPANGPSRSRHRRP
jgi:hypothetical protein